MKAIQRHSIAMLLLQLSTTGVGAQQVDTARAARFDRADRRSRVAIATLRCAMQTARARQEGMFGPADSVGSDGVCMTVGDRLIGVLLDADSTVTRASRFGAVDLRARTRWSAPLDTMAALAVVRAELAAQSRGAARFAQAKRQYAPIAFRGDGDSVEVWLVPAATLIDRTHPSVGGEVGYLYSPDGRTLGCEIDAFDDSRPVIVPDSGVVHIPSRLAWEASFSELVLANLLNDAGRQVAIDAPDGASILHGSGAAAVWIHLVQSPRDGARAR